MARSWRRRARLGSGHHPVWLSLACGLVVVSVSAHSLVAEARGGSPAGHPLGQIVSPQPLPDNPSPAYPDQALSAAVDGDVVFLAQISAEGHVESVRVLDVPKEGVGFEDAVREAVVQWRFQTARSDGVPIPSAYVGKINFTRRLSYTHARMYRQSSQVVWQEVPELAEEWGLKHERRDSDNQIFISRWTGCRDFRDTPYCRSAQTRVGGAEAIPEEFQVHIFVSPFVEPARVHVGSLIRARQGQGEVVHHNGGPVEHEFFSRLEERIREVGQAIPIDSQKHRALAATLLGKDDPCALRPVDAPVLAQGDPPLTLPQLDDVPVFHPLLNAQAVVIVEAAVSFDGSVTSSRIMSVTMTDETGKKVTQDGSLFGQATANAVSLWRYRPPVHDGCAANVTATVITNFFVSEDNERAVHMHVGPFREPVQKPASPMGPVRRVRAGGDIKAPQRIKNVNPIYPPIALSARVTGSVILEARIGPDGKVTEVAVLRSVPLLDGAAVSAVLQWEYTPTLLDGVPVVVIMTATVNFFLRTR